MLKLVQTAPVAPALPRAQAPYVVKFGGSILRSLADLPRVAGEIYRLRRAGLPVVAVVSALAGETDRLLAEAATLCGGSQCSGVARLVSQGEERTAALLAIACDRIGLKAAICSPEELRLETTGDALAATPARLEPDALLEKLGRTGLVIVPGFVGLDGNEERTLLGRGGSDFSAIFIAGEIGADCVRLYKDVDGVFDRDPSITAQALHFEEIDWSSALQLARPLIQPQSVEYAAAKRLAIEIGSIGGNSPTRVAGRVGPARAVASAPPLRVAIAGFGVVGQAVAERLREEPGFEIVAILVRDVLRERRVAAPVALTSDLRPFLDADSDVVVDALSCEDTGAFLCSTLLPRGRHVVSASKRVIMAGHGRFTRAAQANRVKLLYSAAVGGSACILETADRARAAGRVEEFAGVLNGTVNAILDGLHLGLSFEEALGEARRAGFAEENCDFDLSGADAAAKLALVACRAFGIDPEHFPVEVEPLDAAVLARIAGSSERWMQLSTIVRAPGGASGRVSLQPLSACRAIAALPGEWNCGRFLLEDGHVLTSLGRGAGGAATAEAITADLFEIASQPRVDAAPAQAALAV